MIPSSFLSAEEAECMAALEAVKWAKVLQLQQVYFEGDAKVIINYLSASTIAHQTGWCTKGHLDDIQALSLSFTSVSFYYVPRDVNSVADALASQARASTSEVSSTSVSSFSFDMLNNDCDVCFMAGPSINSYSRPECHSINLDSLTLREAVIALDSFGKRGSKVKPKTYISLLQSCIDSDSIENGRKLHSLIGFVRDLNPFVETKLVSMYAKCGSLEDARRVFDQMHERNLFAWSAMIGGYTREQRWKEILELFFWMMAEGINPDEFLLPKILQACANLGDFETGKLIHSFVVRSGMDLCVHVNNSILTMYSKCGKVISARSLLEKMDSKDLITWNSIISGYCQNGKNEEALALFDRMRAEGVEPGLVTWNILISSYNQSGNCDQAMELMEKMDDNGISPDVFTWTSMISGFTQNNRRNQALELFREMMLSGVEPNGVTVASALSACASLKALKKGKELHSVGVRIGSMGDLLMRNSLVDMYSKCGKLESAQQVFDMFPEKDVFTWNSMIGGYAQAGYCGKAYDLFMRMQHSGVRPNVVTWNLMISGHIQNGDEDQAMDLFRKMETEGVIKRNTASWNSLIAGSLQNGQKDKALGIFRQMQSFRARPNSITLLSVLPACANLVAVRKVKEIHNCAFRGGLDSELSVTNSLIDTYAKSGNMIYSRAIFDGLLSRDIISWNSIIAGYVLHGFPKIAIELFDRMRQVGIKPNKGTLASIILAYSLAGMVDEGKQIFSSMIKDHHISPGLEHYSAMVELFGRSGRLGEATEFIEDMAIEPNPTIWATLLTASRVHGNIGLAIHAAENLIKLEQRNSVIHRLLLQLYDLGGKFEDASRMRKLEKRSVTSNSHGCCWVEVGSKVHTFVTDDQSIPNSDSIHAWLDRIREEIKLAVPDSHDTHLNIEEEEKEEISGVHSEKLAIGFSLISSSNVPQSIRIVKNLRVCSDCHRTAKFISLRYGCEIYMNDPKCFHHFKNGQCSCGDYW
ncbi:Pentatricopeptide repeat [Macleaya cordata]|uniref:Pentatricopeptide repeat n=1 Tax=Macleaya cordata TaxID=56857 RepID=A0A200QPF9_MACCD|nr:Pentatricopeptide repeat [Macleaya cordata]